MKHSDLRNRTVHQIPFADPFVVPFDQVVVEYYYLSQVLEMVVKLTGVSFNGENVGFIWMDKNWRLKKNLKARAKTSDKLNLHITAGPFQTRVTGLQV